MSARRAFVATLMSVGLLAGALSQAAGQASVNNCFDTSDIDATKVCRMQVWATYQAIQVAQARHRMTLTTCQFGTNITADRLVESIRGEIATMQPLASKDPIVVAAIAALSPPADCTLGIATQVGGLATGSLLKLCSQGFKAGGDPACLAYLAALRDSLNALSGYEGADKFFCSPKGGVNLKEAALLLIEETKRDLKVQQFRPAAEVMAEALSRKYPCH